MPAGCTNILWYWKMIVGTDKAPVQGFNLMEIDENDKLAGQFVEFNSIAWSIDTGMPSCPSKMLRNADLL